MGTIQVLAPDVAELIAAGEVVERPASIVKELVENSIDAGATQITVEIKGGGIGYIRITDNGHGIAEDDVPLAFLRHATSKVSTVDDLNAISTLGFRGEALASISAVSKVEVVTKQAPAQHGTQYKILGEEVVGPTPAGAPDGTTFIIRDIFYNIPARMKFLKRDITEGNAVAKTVDWAALSHPEIAFTFIRDTTTRLQTSGNGDLQAAIAAVYDRKFAANMIPVDYVSDENIRVTGLVGLPSAPRANRSYQTFFINQRYVRTRTGNVALEQAYKGKLMTGRFPSGVLNIELDPTQVDPNVHPAKIEVRFSNEKPIFNAVYYSVLSALRALEGPLLARSSRTFSDKSGQTDAIEKPDTAENRQQRIDFFANLGETEEKNSPLDNGKKLNIHEPIDFSSGTKYREINVPIREKDITPTNFARYSPAETDTLKASTSHTMGAESISDKSPINMRQVGELFDTYIVIEQNSELLLVDKHAAHERLLYEKIRNVASEKQGRQVLLSPVPVTLAHDEYSIVLEHTAIVENMGFGLEDFGTGTLLVRETPILLEGEDISLLLSEIASKLLQHQANLTPQALEAIFDSVACKAALRAGDKNSPIELQAIINLLVESPHITHCPHGRPIVLRIPQQEIEKMFGRLG